MWWLPLLLAMLVVPADAPAQFTSPAYSTIINTAGTPQVRRTKIKCGVNLTCVDDPVNGWTEISGVGGGGGGDVFGPGSSTDNEVARFDGVTGKVVQDGTACLLNDSGVLTGPCAEVRGVAGIASCSPLVNGTAYFAAGTCADPAQVASEQPAPATMTMVNMRCVSSAAFASGTITLTAKSGSCGGALSNTAFACTLTGGGSRSQCNTGANTLALATNDCWVIEAVASGITGATAVTCSAERSV